MNTTPVPIQALAELNAVMQKAREDLQRAMPELAERVGQMSRELERAGRDARAAFAAIPDLRPSPHPPEEKQR